MDSHQWDSAMDPEIAPLFLALQWAQQRSMAVMEPLLRRFSLSVAEFDVLASLRNSPAPYEMTPTQIQHEIVITSGGLTKILLQLETRALVERSQLKNDLRIKPVRLTSSGVQTIEAAMAEMIGATGRWIRSALKEDEIKQLSDLLSRLVGNQQPEESSTDNE
jgi:DNA-binding MarR family transcriptional regulator